MTPYHHNLTGESVRNLTSLTCSKNHIYKKFAYLNIELPGISWKRKRVYFRRWLWLKRCGSHLKWHAAHFRGSHRWCSLRKGVLRNFTKFTRKHLCQNIFLNKVAALSPVTLLKWDSGKGVFLWILQNF